VARADAELNRVHDLNVSVTLVSSRAATEDLALLLVREAETVVLVGVPRDLEELLDRGRQAAGSSLLVRFSMTSRLLPPAAAAASVHRRRWGLVLLCAVLGALLAASMVVGHEVLLDRWQELT
jgi:uncharacterized membrane-anchored protein